MIARHPAIRIASLALLALSAPLQAQVHYHDDGQPWKQRAPSGPDAEVPGWFYNLGITGLRAQLVADDPKVLFVKYVFPKSPADSLIQAEDRIIGAGGQLFKNEHQNGYGMKLFGAVGPISEFADALEACQSATGKGKLALTLRRGSETKEVVLPIGQKYGTYAATYPAKCAKSDHILAEMLQYLADHQKADGSFGNPVHNTFAPLAMLASGDPKYLPAVERCVRYHCKTTQAKDPRKLDLINWSYMGAAFVLSEYYLSTKQAWVLPELQEIHDYLASSQYLDMKQIDPKSKETHPRSFPTGPADSHGSPVMGMCFTALTANIVPANFRKLMDANRWWFTLAQCADGSFYYQPNRDNAGYGPDARMTATAATAFIFTIPKHSLVLTGKAISPAKP